MAQQAARKQVSARDLTILGGIVFLLTAFSFTIAQFSGSLKSSPFAQLSLAPRKGIERPPGPVVQLEPFTVSLSGDDRATLLRVKLVLELDNWKAMTSIKQHLAPVQFAASSVLAEQTFGSLHSSQGKQLLRARLYEAITQTLPEGGVKAVYFREFLYE